MVLAAIGTPVIQTIECMQCQATSDVTPAAATLRTASWAFQHERDTGHADYRKITTRFLRIHPATAPAEYVPCD
ncbi:hypothetical protein [Streptomyces sp. NPDC020141]|uniref:DUF7848 domain-containing protein n=1 Tax=Streptomyces sp. NPDC020141 TaxID=3365065 RepID=UPI0037B201FF